MPTYTYKCTNSECSQNEVEHTVKKKMIDPTPDCTECSQGLSQVYKSATHFVLKGRGWTGSNIAGS